MLHVTNTPTLLANNVNAGERDASKGLKNNHGTCYLLRKSEPSKFSNFNTLNRKKTGLWNEQDSYFGRRRSHRANGGDAPLGGDVAARCRHGNRDWRWEQRRDNREGEQPRAVVAIDDGRGTAVIGSSIVEARRTDVSPLPGSPVVPLKTVVVA